MIRRLITNGEPVIQYYETFETNNEFLIIMDYMPAGDLYNLLKQNQKLCEREAALAVKGILQGLKYFQKLGIIHGDIKLENILLSEKNSCHKLKIAGFCLSCFNEPVNIGKLRRCGTPGYIAPEILDQQAYNHQADVFSVGVILFCL